MVPLDIDSKEDLVGFESIFDADHLLGVDSDMNMLDDMGDEFLEGMETPLASLAAFDDAPMFDPREDNLKRIIDSADSPNDSALKMISYLQAQLKAKEDEIQRLKRSSSSDINTNCNSTTSNSEFVNITSTRVKNLADDFDMIVQEAVGASSKEEDDWMNTTDPLGPCLDLDPLDADLPTPDEVCNSIADGSSTAPSSPASAMDTVSEKPVVCITKSELTSANNLKEESKVAKAATVEPKIKTCAPARTGSSASCTVAVAAKNTSESKINHASKKRSLESSSDSGRAGPKKARVSNKSFLGRKIKSEPIQMPESPCSDSGCKSKKMARRWTADQDEELKLAVEKHNGQNWKAIAKMVQDRDHVQCLQRWKKVLQPGLVKGMWSKEEDDLLLRLMSSSQPKNWADIAAKVPGRTAKQCRERWSLNLDPSINRGSWTQDEDELLLKLHEKLGNRWAEIKRHLNGRTENGVKTRFKSIERARTKDKEVVWTAELESQLNEIAVRFECRIDEVSKHLPRALRGISSQAMRDHCTLLRESESSRINASHA